MDKRQNAIASPFDFSNVFAMLIIETADGKRLIRPIGGEWENGINDSIESIATEYPNCKMGIFERRFDGGRKYFAPNGIGRAQLI